MKKNNSNTFAISSIDKAFYTFNNIIIFIFFLIILYPLIYVVSASFSDATKVVSGQVWLWPVGFNIDGYVEVFKHKLILSGYMNSIIYMVSGTIINVVITVMAAYPLSRSDFKMKNVGMFLITFTMLFSGGMIPDYLLVKNLGLYNTRWAMILPTAMAAWNVILTRTYFQNSIPNELLEAAQVDGCSDVKFIIRIALPLSMPIISVIALFYAIAHWNSYFTAMLYLSKSELYPLQIVLRDILVLNSFNIEFSGIDVDEMERKTRLAELLKYSLIIVASLPVMVIYPFVQKYFVQGIMVGSIKG